LRAVVGLPNFTLRVHSDRTWRVPSRPFRPADPDASGILVQGLPIPDRRGGPVIATVREADPVFARHP
jgi:hypothetical protein